MKFLDIRNSLFALPALILILFSACEKDKNILPSEDSQFPSRLYPINSIIISTKVYSRDGEVTDPVLKAGAYETTGMNILLRPKNQSFAGDSSWYIRFRNRTQFLVEPAAEVPYNVTKTDSLFVFTSNDSGYNAITNPLTYYMQADMFFKYPEMTYQSSTSAISRRKFSAYGNYNKLSIRGIDLCVLRRDSTTKVFKERFFRTTYNEFDTTSIKYLGKYDTISVRRYDVNYSK